MITRIFPIASTALIIACGGPAGTDDLASGPTITRLPLDQLGANGPERRLSALTVSPFGHVAFTTGFTEGDEVITVVDSTGRVVSRFGRRGSGPAELREANVLFFADSVILVSDGFQGRLHRYSMRGDYQGYDQFPGAYFPLGYVRDSIDLSDYYQTTGPRVIRWAVGETDSYRTLVPKGDTLWLDFAKKSGTSPPRITAGSTPAGTFIGDGLTYQLFEFGVDSAVEFGRNMSPRTIGTGPDADTVAYFGLFGAATDGRGRLWVAGSERVGGFLDVYENHQLVRRFETDCRVNPWYGMSVNGSWLALLCDAEEADPVEVHLELYRIEG